VRSGSRARVLAETGNAYNELRGVAGLRGQVVTELDGVLQIGRGADGRTVVWLRNAQGAERWPVALRPAKEWGEPAHRAAPGHGSPQATLRGGNQKLLRTTYNWSSARCRIRPVGVAGCVAIRRQTPGGLGGPGQMRGDLRTAYGVR